MTSDAEVHEASDEMCREPDCTRQDGLACWEPDSDPNGPPDTYYCEEHAFDAGFCVGCGLFCAGMESFDFNPAHLCENCQATADAETADLDEIEDPYDDDGVYPCCHDCGRVYSECECEE